LFDSAPLCAVMEPLPVRKSPDHTAFACRFMNYPFRVEAIIN
jgi:hypothetical protein